MSKYSFQLFYVSHLLLSIHQTLCVCFALQEARDLHREEQALEQLEADRACVAEHLQHQGNNGKPADAQKRQEALQRFIASREARVHDFLQALKHKRNSFFLDLCSEMVLN